jgi:hypothetical protein
LGCFPQPRYFKHFKRQLSWHTDLRICTSCWNYRTQLSFLCLSLIQLFGSFIFLEFISLCQSVLRASVYLCGAKLVPFFISYQFILKFSFFFFILGFCILLRLLYQDKRWQHLSNNVHKHNLYNRQRIRCNNSNFFYILYCVFHWWWPVKAETYSGRGIKYNKRLEQLLWRKVFSW